MADLESSFRSLVLSNSDVATLFGGRFYWNRVPDGAGDAYPYIRATTIADPPIHYQNKRPGSRLGKATVQLDIWDIGTADGKTRVNLSAEMLRDWLDGYRGPIGDYEGRILAKDVPSSWDEEQRSFRRILEVEIGYAKP